VDRFLADRPERFWIVPENGLTSSSLPVYQTVPNILELAQFVPNLTGSREIHASSDETWQTNTSPYFN